MIGIKYSGFRAPSVDIKQTMSIIMAGRESARCRPSEIRMLFRRIALSSLLASVALAATAGAPLSYPQAVTGNVSGDYHGVKVPDPYRWMEDIDSPGTRAWVEAEDKLSRGYLNAIPGRDAIAQRLKQIWNFERWTAPEKHGRYWYYTHNDGLQNQAVIFVTPDPKSPGHVLIDPNTLSKD